MHIYKRCYFIFLAGGIGYCILELLWRGYTHPSMGIAGGLCLIEIYYINLFCKEHSRTFRSLLCAAAITVTELLFGIVLNIALKLNVWDYSHLPLNFMGQICLWFSLIWFAISYSIIYLSEKSGFITMLTEKEHG